MKRKKGIFINGEWLGGLVVIDELFRTICNISPKIIKEFVQTINEINTSEQEVKITNFQYQSQNAMVIEFKNEVIAGNVQLFFKSESGEIDIIDKKVNIYYNNQPNNNVNGSGNDGNIANNGFNNYNNSMNRQNYSGYQGNQGYPQNFNNYNNSENYADNSNGLLGNYSNFSQNGENYSIPGNFSNYQSYSNGEGGANYPQNPDSQNNEYYPDYMNNSNAQDFQNNQYNPDNPDFQNDYMNDSNDNFYNNQTYYNQWNTNSMQQYPQENPNFQNSGYSQYPNNGNPQQGVNYSQGNSGQQVPNNIQQNMSWDNANKFNQNIANNKFTNNRNPNLNMNNINNGPNKLNSNKSNVNFNPNINNKSGSSGFPNEIDKTRNYGESINGTEYMGLLSNSDKSLMETLNANIEKLNEKLDKFKPEIFEKIANNFIQNGGANNNNYGENINNNTIVNNQFGYGGFPGMAGFPSGNDMMIDPSVIQQFFQSLADPNNRLSKFYKGYMFPGAEEDTGPEQKLMTLSEYLDAEKIAMLRKKKKKRSFNIMSSKERRSNVNELEDGYFIGGKKIYKWGEPKQLDG